MRKKIFSKPGLGMMTVATSTALGVVVLIGGLMVVGALPGCNATPTVAKQDRMSAYSTKPYAKALEVAVKTKHGLVDYAALKKQAEAQLNVYLDAVGRFGPKTTPKQFQSRDAKLAYYINAYNAFMLRKWLNEGAATAGPNASVGKNTWFTLTSFDMDGGSTSMDSLEQDLIRPKFKEPRVHSALICGAQSCPPLRDEPYSANKLDKQLDDQMKTWLSQPDGLRIGDDGKVYMSAIFKWYRKDFKSLGGLAGMVKKYVPNGQRQQKALEALKNDNVHFMDYDWTINSVKAAKAKQTSK